MLADAVRTTETLSSRRIPALGRAGTPRRAGALGRADGRLDIEAYR
jgi:hypothetical protein